MQHSSCIVDVLRSIDGDDELRRYVQHVFVNEVGGTKYAQYDSRKLIQAFVDAMKAEDMLSALKTSLDIPSSDSKHDKSLKLVSDKFFEALASRCSSREKFKAWFDPPDLFERGVGMLIFSLIFLYGWIGEETSSAFSDAMQSSRTLSESMSLSELLMADYLEMGSIQILWVTIVALAKSWLLLAALIAGFFFVEAFIVEAAMNPVNLAALMVNTVLMQSAGSEGKGSNSKCEPIFPTIPLSVLKNPMKSIRVATFFMLDRRVIYSIIMALLISILFSSCCAVYLALANASPDDAKFVGKMACAFQLLIVFLFVAFILMGSDVL